MSNTGSPSDYRIGFKKHLRAEVVAGDATYLFSERGVTAIKGAAVERLAPLLDGTRTLSALIADTQGTELQPELGAMINAGLVGLRATTDDVQDAYWEANGIDADAAAETLATATVAVFGVGDVDTAECVEALRAAGLDARIAPVTELGEMSMSIVICADYAAPELADIDAAHRLSGVPWLLARPRGAQVWIGPVFTGGNQACWQCLSHRMWLHRGAEAHVQASCGRSGPTSRPLPTLAPLLAMAHSLIALETLKWLAGQRYPGQQAVWTLDSTNLTGQHHQLARRPQCPGCGTPTLQAQLAERPIVLRSRPVTSTSGGGHRCAPPDEVLRTYQHLISPVTGILKGINRDPRGPQFLNSYRAGSNLAVAGHGVEGLRSALRAQNGGKGVTPLHAKVSALCEAAERYSGSFHGDERRIHASLRDLGERAIHPDGVQLYARSQQRDREQWNRAQSGFQYVCAPFDPDLPMDWTPVWSHTEGRHRLLPTGLLYFGAPAESAPPCVRADSNGNAAGSSFEDAVLQGLFELVERDAVAIWWYNRLSAPAVDIDSFTDPWIEQLREVYRGLHREVWVLDVTSDVGVPTMVALSRRLDKPSEDIMFGFGAHVDPAIALRRALSELNQLMPTLADIGPENDYRCDDAAAVSWWRSATVANQPYLLPDPELPARTKQSYAYRPNTDLLVDVEALIARIESLGLEVLLLDQTRPDIGLPVVKVIVPGMRTFWARFAPGRLFEVPVKLGKLAAPTEYADLNPIPLFV